MSILKREPKPDPAMIYTAHTGFAWAGEGGPRGIRAGTRLRGDDLIVRATFSGGLWVEDGASSTEIVAARMKTATPAPPAPTPVVAPVYLMRCTSPTTTTIMRGGQRVEIPVTPGDVLPDTDEAVLAHPECFERAY